MPRRFSIEVPVAVQVTPFTVFYPTQYYQLITYINESFLLIHLFRLSLEACPMMLFIAIVALRMRRPLSIRPSRLLLKKRFIMSLIARANSAGMVFSCQRCDFCQGIPQFTNSPRSSNFAPWSIHGPRCSPEISFDIVRNASFF